MVNYQGDNGTQKTQLCSTKELPRCPTHRENGFLSKLGETVVPDHTQVLSQLRSGHIPSEEEKAAISVTIRDQEAKIQALEDEKNRLTSLIRQIEEQQREVELEVEYQSGLLAPIRHLPDELLSEIMLYSTRGRVDVCSPFSDAWKLERVCKRWRNVAISIQELWSSIDIFMGNLTSYKPDAPMRIVEDLVDRCLRRSQSHSLSIKFIEIGSPSRFWTIFDHLSLASHRWRDISFSLSLFSESRPPLLDNGLTRLRSLGLSGLYGGRGTFSSFQHAQQLTQLRLFSVTTPFRTLILPWSQLTYLKTVYCEFRTGEFMEMLRQTPNLVEFTSNWNRGLTKNLPNGVKPIFFRSLRSFEIQASPVEIYNVFQPVAFPKLTELYITHLTLTKNLPICTPDSITSAIRRSQCFITTLSLSSDNAGCVSRILEETPHLINLTLEYINNLENVLCDLSRPDLLVPDLVNFTMTCKINQGMVIVGPLVEMVRARASTRTILSSGRFRSLNLTLKAERGVKAITRLLKPLSAEHGVAIVIHSLPA
ncbi:hypothetical protein M413DRAFT_447694 [Hebeloma cylindrosporum]|uniref:F-box domain-containing protein n=1 Tax=Hebeloma cylindrosporum TaxID=76867 RepID=A0A0C3C3A8_HEBCY|nr:hypothetical protein M413DRAFT_447694 [Hebeloma cylindrosporum h7]